MICIYDNLLLNKLRKIAHRMQDGKELAEYVFSVVYKDKGIHSKLDVFNLCNILGVNFVPSELEEVDGVYISERIDRITKQISRPLIALNVNKGNIRRLKFTLAHEICHHIKDFNSETQMTILNDKDLDIPYSQREKFANEFASELLIPTKMLKKVLSCEQITEDNVISKLADFFEVSKSSIKLKLNELNVKYIEPQSLNDSVDYKIKLQYINAIAPTAKKTFNLHLKSNINDIVSNDSRFELSNLNLEKIAEIVFDIEAFKHSKEEMSDEDIEVIGLYHMYNDLLKETESPNQYTLKDYHNKLYELADYSPNGYRNTNNIITNSSVSTCDFQKIREEMFFLFKEVDKFLDYNNLESIQSFYDLSFIHQQITKIHPFNDGNGRTSRLLNNWLLKTKGYPFISIKLNKKNEYLEALKSADENNFNELNYLFINCIYENYNDYIISSN